MKYLSPENIVFENIAFYDKYAVLDTALLDFFFIPALKIEQLETTFVELLVGNFKVTIPQDWSIAITDHGYLELVEVGEVTAEREFSAFVTNPVRGSMGALPIRLTGRLFNRSLSSPIVKRTHLLGMPLGTGKAPGCIFVARPSNRCPEQIDLADLV